ncbi:hypothetical protein [Maritimibacter fusiformis]|uniref:Uncharacterized protein n=1 Tax=Maritimibacter fusiformis TaxID=2603819 RepID=A0A5D0RIP3_9RHOB|nr:hypothetical protein [Maritimibacter fusiformis]TYB81477.1 hypothetical protein FVF75_10250 [Maritimibacter fusiformis]
MTKGNKQRVETDHEFRQRMADEGRAIYVSGKSADQVKTEQQRYATEEFPVSLHMTAQDADEVGQALEDAQYLFGHAAEALATLHNGLSGGWLNEEPGAASLCYLAGIAMGHKADTDGATLMRHFTKLQRAVYQARNANRGK